MSPDSGFGQYDFGLTAEQEARATRLHEESIVVDMLFWGPVCYHAITPQMEKIANDLWQATHDADRCTIAALSLPVRMAIQGVYPPLKEHWDASGVTAGSQTVDGFTSIDALATTFGLRIAQFDHLPWLVKALCAADIRRAKREGKRAGWINTQLSMGVGPNFLSLLRPAHDLGLRMVQLTYNNMTLIGAGGTEITDAGLSAYGVKVVAEMNRLGILVDTGHCGRQTTLDACAVSKKPVIASHTMARGVYRHARAKDDAQLQAIAASGGVIGVVTVPFYLAPGERVTIEAMLDHIDYIANLVGWRHVGIGSDWPMPMAKSTLGTVFAGFTAEAGFRPEHHIDTAMDLVGFDDYRDFINIARGLVKRGYTDEQIQGILGENFLLVFEQVCG